MRYFFILVFLCSITVNVFSQHILENISTLPSYDNYCAQLKVFQDSFLYYREHVGGNYIPADRKIVIDKYSRATLTYENRLQKFIQQNKGNEWSAISLLIAVYNNSVNDSTLIHLYESLTDNESEDMYTLKLREIIKARKNLRANKMTDLFFPDSKNIRHLSDIQSHYILLNFWASWCGPCRAKNALLKMYYAQYKNKGIEVVSISLDENKYAWQKAARDDGITWLNINEAQGFYSDAAIFYNVAGLPKTFMIDTRNGYKVEEWHNLPQP